MKNEKISIRIAGEEDAAALAAIYAPYVEQTAVTFEYTAPSADEFRGRILATEKRYPFLVAELNGISVGYAYASGFKERIAYSWSVETSIYVKRELRQQGIGKALYQALEAVLRLQGILNVNACIAFPDREDEYLTRDSVLFHECMGYRLVGTFRQCGYKFDRWYSMVWMEKHLGNHTVPQKPVISFAEIRAEAEKIL